MEEDELEDRKPCLDRNAVPGAAPPWTAGIEPGGVRSPGEAKPPCVGSDTSRADINSPVAEVFELVPVVHGIVSRLDDQIPLLSSAELVSLASNVEALSRLVDHLQVIAAAALERARISAEISETWTTPAGKVQQEYKNTADYMRHRLRISRREAWRRIRLGSSLTSSTGIAGQPIEPEFAVLAGSAAQGHVSGDAAQLVSMAMKRVQGCGASEDRTGMEAALTDVAGSQDLDVLSVVAQAWINHLDPDGSEPSEQQKAEVQGLFIRRKYRGLHRLDIYASEDQFETLMTALSPEANPRAGAALAKDGTCSDLEDKERAVPPDPRSYPQKCLDGLVESCRLALSSGHLPSNGGSKPQVMAIIPYDQLLDSLDRTPGKNGMTGTTGVGGISGTLGSTGMTIGTTGFAQDEYGFTDEHGFSGKVPDGSKGRPHDSDQRSTPDNGMLSFAGPVPAHQIRRIACDADIIPVVLNGEGRILDVGTAARYFPPHLRRALIARDRGCAFPGCTSPAPWCEAHHINYHSHGGSTGTDNGVLLCGFHHHLIHREKWLISVRQGAPWFIPPVYVDPFQTPLRNTSFHPFRSGHRQE